MQRKNESKKRVLVFYPKITLANGGSSIHGYYLLKHLMKLGYIVRTAKNEVIEQNKVGGNLIIDIIKSDIIYYRPYFNFFSNFLLKILSIFKKVVVELNGPPDELLIKGKSKAEVEIVDKRLKSSLKNVAHVIVVSDVLAEYCRKILFIENISTINNGGEVLRCDPNKISGFIKKDIESIKAKYKKIVIWSGTHYPWQGYEYIKQLVLSEKTASFAFIIISDDYDVLKELQNLPNVFLYSGLSRDDIAYLITNSDIGCALYGDFSRTRTGFYNSPLKFHEYLVNGLGIIASPYDYFVKYKNGNVLLSHEIEEMISFINNFDLKVSYSQRTWETVAKETANIFESI